MRTCVVVLLCFVSQLPKAAAGEEATAAPESLVEAIARARELIATDAPTLPYQFTAPKPGRGQNEAFLDRLIGHQKVAALSETQLANALEELESLKEVRDAAPRRWQALYDYTVVCLLNRMVARREYNCALGELRRTLLDQPMPAGWELVSQDRPHDASGQKLWKRAAEETTNVLTNYEDLPWLMQLAKRERLTGFTWKSVAP